MKSEINLETDDIILVADGWRVSRAEHLDRITKTVSILRDIGVGPGDCIGIALRNCPQFLELLAAASALKAKTVPIAWRLKHEEVHYLVEDSGAKCVFYDTDSASQMTGLPSMSLEKYEQRLTRATPASGFDGSISRFELQLYSSGTTGRPKAIKHEAPVVTEGKPSQVGSLNFLGLMGVAQPGEIHMMCGPFYHSQPIGFATSALVAGHRVVMMGGSFDAETCLATIEKERVTWITCVPTHLIRILALPENIRNKYDLSSLKAVLHSAAPCPRDVKKAVIDMFPPNTVWENYGGTEGVISMISPREWLEKPGSVGRAFLPGTELKIMDSEGNQQPVGTPGLIYAQPTIKFSYRGSKELNDQTWRDGLFTLGDVGYLDEDGYLFITDRLKDMIISGGANIYPAEVEAVLFNHPAVGDVAVIGIPDSHWGEKVRAIVETRGETSEAEIIAFCRENLAHYKCPTSVDFVEKLPRDPSGKVRKRDLREAYWADAGRAV
jgi:long-chain acyl-CoA synthetase